MTTQEHVCSSQPLFPQLVDMPFQVLSHMPFSGRVSVVGSPHIAMQQLQEQIVLGVFLSLEAGQELSLSAFRFGFGASAWMGADGSQEAGIFS